MKPVYVIAGNNREFEQWCRENRVFSSSPLVRYISEFEGPRLLRGVKSPQIISYGTYYMRKDFRELNDLIRERTRPEVIVKIVYMEAPKKEVSFSDVECFRKVAWRN
jgi:hypothetical protein